MKRKILVKQLQKTGWVITPGARHDMAKHPDRPGVKIPIPRHSEIPEYTARGILKAAGLEYSPNERSEK